MEPALDIRLVMTPAALPELDIRLVMTPAALPELDIRLVITPAALPELDLTLFVLELISSSGGVTAVTPEPNFSIPDFSNGYV